MKQSDPKTGSVQHVIACVMAVVFVATIFSFGAYGLVSNVDETMESLRFHKAKGYLTDPDDVSFFPMLSARISSLQSQLGENIPFKEELGYLNASVQYGLGKKMVVQGVEQLLTLPGGQIYNMTTRRSLAAEAREIVDFYHQLDGSVPFLFAYVNPQFYEGSIELPAGYDVIDRGDELADEVLGIVRDAGIPALDSRDFFVGSGYTDDELFLRTDMHWTTLAALHATPIFVSEINRASAFSYCSGYLSL